MAKERGTAWGPSVIFDEGPHSYQVVGHEDVELRSVTQVVGKSGPWFSSKHAERGTLVHEATAALDVYGADIAEPELSGWIKAYEHFKRFYQERYKILAVEVRIANIGMGLAGTVDRVCSLGGELMVVDLKSGVKARWHKDQVELYAKMLGIFRGATLYIAAEGSWSLDPYRFQERTYP
jgi:hypothetical protein